MSDNPIAARTDLPAEPQRAAGADRSTPGPAADLVQKAGDLRARMEARQHTPAGSDTPPNRLGVAGLRAGEAIAEAKGKEGLAMGLRFAADYWKLKAAKD